MKSGSPAREMGARRLGNRYSVPEFTQFQLARTVLFRNRGAASSYTQYVALPFRNRIRVMLCHGQCQSCALVETHPLQKEGEGRSAEAIWRRLLALRLPDAIQRPAELRKGGDDRTSEAARERRRLGPRESSSLPCRLQSPPRRSDTGAEGANADRSNEETRDRALRARRLGLGTVAPCLR